MINNCDAVFISKKIFVANPTMLEVKFTSSSVMEE